MEPPMSNNLGSQQVSIPNKPMAQMVPMSSSPRSQQFSVPNKRTTQMVHIASNLGSQPLSTPNKRMTQVGPMPANLGSQHLSIPNKRNAQMEPSPKGQAESFESVRAKLRESLAASLALVSKQQSTEEKNSQSEVASTSKPDNEDPRLAESTSATLGVGSCNIPEKPMENSSKDIDSVQKVNNSQISSQEIIANENTENAIQTSKFDGQDFQFNYVLLDDDVSFSNSFFIKDDLLQGNGLCWASDLEVDGSEVKENHLAKRPKLLHEEEGGNGIELALQSPQALATRIEVELFKLFGGVNKKYKEKGRSLLFNLKDRNNPELRERVVSGEIPPERLCAMTAEELASKELSEWRIAKAEELAHMVVLQDSDVNVRRLVKKTHKGEFQVEFEQDDGASAEVAVGASSLSQFRPKTSEKEAQALSKPNETETTEVGSEKVNLEDQSLQSSLTIPNDGSDLMQGLVVDELKDAEFLPPIVSLDEFMESLDSEPPFEDLPVDAAGQSLPTSDEKKSIVGSKLGSSDLGSTEEKRSAVGSKVGSSDICSTDPIDSALDKPDKVEVKYRRTASNPKSNYTPIELETSPPSGASKAEHVWEGLLQLNISAMVAVIGYFKSGEKTSVKDWPSFLDIKGRVRLDAFEKFLQELRMSRSRAIMVLHFCWKEDSPESGRDSLREVVDSYVVDERVGFAEPAPAVELYLCPPHKRTVEMLCKHLPKDHTETLNTIENGVIGIVLWRKPHLTSKISPNSSSHHKHSSKKSRKQQERETYTNSNMKTPRLLDPTPTNREPPVEDEPIDDVPPGFGPAAAREEDDLPEFNFVGGSNLPVSQFSTHNSSRGSGMAHFQTPTRPPSRPVEQMRELIHKYGNSEMNSNQVNNWQQNRGVGVEVEPWNDDDDIPEWQPQPPTQQVLPPPPPAQLVHSLQQLNLPPHMVNQQHLMSLPPHYPSQQQLVSHPVQLQSPQPPINVMQGQQNVATPWPPGTQWTLQPGSQPHSGNGMMQPCNFGGQPFGGQFYGTPSGFGAGHNGMDWRPDDPRSRGGF